MMLELIEFQKTMPLWKKLHPHPLCCVLSRHRRVERLCAMGNGKLIPRHSLKSDLSAREASGCFGQLVPPMCRLI